MAKRRSMDDALTPEDKKFIYQGTKPVSAPKPKTVKKKSVRAKQAVEDVQPEPVATVKDSPANSEGAMTRLTVAIEMEINNALLRASLERKLRKQAPYTQRDIVSEAIAQWLKTNALVK